MGYRITTDACSDLDYNYTVENNITALPLAYTLNEKSYVGSLEATQNCKEFYELVRAGGMPKTSMINSETHKDYFEKILKEGDDILHICFSSSLSGTYQGAVLAGKELEEMYPERKVMVVDSLCASMGQALLVYKVNNFKNTGASISEAFDFAETLKHKIVLMFTVDDLNHLQRGGRVSKLAAVFGTMLKIKPVLHMDKEGKLTPVGKVKGRKKALSALVDSMVEKMKGFEDENDIFFVSHGDCLEDAQYVADKIVEATGIKDYKINFIGPVVGTHSGPGTVALFFVGNPR